MATILAKVEVIGFARDCLRLHVSAEVACALGQLFALRVGASLQDIECDDFDERFSDPTPDEWRRALGNFDIEQANELCDLVAG